MNSFYKKQREDTLLRLINPRATEEDMRMVAEVLDYVEKEIASAFKRGLHSTRKPGLASSRGGNYRREPEVEYPPSALRAGKLTPATVDVEEIQE